MAHGSVPAGPTELLPLNSNGGMMWHPLWIQNIHAVPKTTGGSHGCPLISGWPLKPKIMTFRSQQNPAVYPRRPWTTMQIRPKLQWKLLSAMILSSLRTRVPKQVTHSWKNPFWAWHEIMPLKRVNKPPAEHRLGHLGQSWLSQCSSQLDVRE